MADTPAAPPADPYVMTADQIYSMTPDQATAALAAMDHAIHPPPSVVPQDAQDARATLEMLSRNASWADSLFKGNVETRKQFDELVAKAAGGDAVLVMPSLELSSRRCLCLRPPQTVSFRAGTSRGRSRA